MGRAVHWTEQQWWQLCGCGLFGDVVASHKTRIYAHFYHAGNKNRKLIKLVVCILCSYSSFAKIAGIEPLTPFPGMIQPSCWWLITASCVVWSYRHYLTIDPAPLLHSAQRDYGRVRPVSHVPYCPIHVPCPMSHECGNVCHETTRGSSSSCCTAWLRDTLRLV